MAAHPAALAVAELTGHCATAVRPLGGQLFTVRLAGGESVVAKRHDEPSAVRAETASLAWLAEPGVVRLPDVLGSDDHWLVLTLVAEGVPSGPAAAALGRALAALHQSGAPAFGAAPPGGPVQAWIGTAEMRNEPNPLWPSWYAEHRLEPYLRLAVDAGYLDGPSAQVIGEVCGRVEELAGAPERPARLHGDLWSGNVLWAGEQAWLIDPAAHGGHRETDLAMLALFGCPELDRIVAAYREATPLAEGWRARVPLHQLFPLLVHTVLFGGGYAARAAAAARAALTA
ncbi:MAG: fructosamine kinase family protein [Labedaea sp.]